MPGKLKAPVVERRLLSLTFDGFQIQHQIKSLQNENAF